MNFDQYKNVIVSLDKMVLNTLFIIRGHCWSMFSVLRLSMVIVITDLIFYIRNIAALSQMMVISFWCTVAIILGSLISGKCSCHLLTQIS